MTTINIAQMIQQKIIYLFAYFPIISSMGFLQSWLTYKMGDDTAKNWGFLTLDPLVHFDPVGFFILMFPWQLFGIDINIGFGKFIPTSPDGLYGKFKKLRQSIILFSAAIAAMITWLSSTVILVVAFYFGIKVFQNNTVFISFLRLLSGLSSLSGGLFFVFFVINTVDAILYVVDKRGVIRNNLLFRFLLILIASIVLIPIMHAAFRVITNYLVR